MEQRGGKHQKVTKKSLWFYYVYKLGIVQSFVAHIILLLVLALSFTVIKQQPHISLKVVFDPVEEVSMEPIEMPQPDMSNNTTTEYVVNTELEQVVVVDLDDNLNSVIPQYSAMLPISTSDLMLTVPMPMEMKVVRSTGVSDKAEEGAGFKRMMFDKLDRRLQHHNAQTGDVQISIAWDDFNDIDLWVVYEDTGPNKHRSEIGWSNKFGAGGFLDIDMNMIPLNKNPVENIFWNKGSAPYGKYTIYVHYYHRWDSRTTTPVFVRIQVDNEIIYRKTTANINRGWTKVYSFIRKKPQKQ